MSDPRRPGEPGEPTGPDAAPSQVAALRAFLRSSTGGALVSVAAVLLIVVVLLAVRGRPSQSTERTSAGAANSATATATGAPGTTSGSAAPSSAVTTPDGPATTPPARTSAGPTTPGATRPGGVRPSAPATHQVPGGPVEGSAPTVTRAQLTVLNNTTVSDLAHNAARDFSNRGWSVVRVGNYTGKIPATTVYYTPGSAAEERAARDLASEFPQIGRVLPRYEGLPSSVHGVIVVITPDWLNAG